jgi:hypothetical protein
MHKLLCIAALACSSALHSEDRTSATYPVQLTILESKISIHRGSLHGSGRGRIRTAGHVNGIDFQYDCPARLAISYNGELYAARWKNAHQLMALLPGDSNTPATTCELNVIVHPFLYVTQNGHLATISQQQWATRHPGGIEHAEGDDAPPEPPRTDDSTIIHPN